MGALERPLADGLTAAFGQEFVKGERLGLLTGARLLLVQINLLRDQIEELENGSSEFDGARGAYAEPGLTDD